MSDGMITLDDARAMVPNFDEIITDLAAIRGYSWGVTAEHVLSVIQPRTDVTEAPYVYQLPPPQPPNRHERRRQARMTR